MVTVDELSAALERLLPTAERRDAPASSEPDRIAIQVSAAKDFINRDSISELSTHMWRMGKRLVDQKSGRPLEETRKVFRHYEACIDTLKKAGIEILDHTGEPFDAGLSLQVLTYQPTEGLDRDRVIETVRPTVYLGEDRIQMGVVIVGTPQTPNE
jgi:molecular chaperone GrpE (heat shock protein)